MDEKNVKEGNMKFLNLVQMGSGRVDDVTKAIQHIIEKEEKAHNYLKTQSLQKRVIISKHRVPKVKQLPYST